MARDSCLWCRPFDADGCSGVASTSSSALRNDGSPAYTALQRRPSQIAESVVFGVKSAMSLRATVPLPSETALDSSVVSVSVLFRRVCRSADSPADRRFFEPVWKECSRRFVKHEHWWLGGAVVRALDLRLEAAGSNPSRCTVECDLGQVVHTHCPAPLVLQPYGAI